jgi:sucrose-phosphate synthase
MDSGRVLVADIDGTLLGDDAALECFAAWHAANRRHRLVYATGRHRESLQRIIAATALPAPDAAITAVGTEIHDQSGRRWPGWAERFDGFEADVVRLALGAFSWLALQPDDAQTWLKASYDARDLADAQLAEVRTALVQAGQDARIVYSARLHLDILPAAAGKGSAAGFLADAWGVPPDGVMAFGDTGNDIDLFRSGFRGTVVANALPELIDAIDDDVYRSPLPFAAGVLDGISYWTGAGPRLTRTTGRE